MYYLSNLIMVSESREKKIVETLASCESFGDPQQYYNKLVELKKEFYRNPRNHHLISLLESFGNKERFLILDMLKSKDRCVCELEAILQKSQPAISHHLRILEANNLIQARKVGKFSHYSLVHSQFEKFQNSWREWVSDISNWMGSFD
ncbi:hypothetical protein WKT22_00357 [Candidatus Lokiarchaeum ossiferum]